MNEATPATTGEAARHLLRRFAPAGSQPANTSCIPDLIELMRRPATFSGPLDQFGRRDESCEDMCGLVRPRLDELAEKYWGTAFRRPKARVHLTHDLDRFTDPPRFLWPKLKVIAWKSLVTGRLRQAIRLWAGVRRARRVDPTLRLDELLAAGRGIPRTVNACPMAADDMDAEGIVGHPSEAVLRRWLDEDETVSLGCHPGFTANGEAELRHCRSILGSAFGRDVDSLRMHYYRIFGPTFFHDAARAGFKFDMSIGLSREAGARHGIHHPFFPICGDRVSPIPTLPTLFMDPGERGGRQMRGATLDDTLDWISRWGATGAVLTHTGEDGAAWTRELIAACRARGIGLEGTSQLLVA